MQIIAVPFEFQGKEYGSLVRIKPGAEGHELQVTIMNGDLERALYGKHIFFYRQGVLQVYIRANDQELVLLQERIGWALTEYFFNHPIPEMV